MFYMLLINNVLYNVLNIKSLNVSDFLNLVFACLDINTAHQCIKKEAGCQIGYVIYAENNYLCSAVFRRGV